MWCATDKESPLKKMIAYFVVDTKEVKNRLFSLFPPMHRLPSLKYRDGKGGENERESHLSFFFFLSGELPTQNKTKTKKKTKKKKTKERKGKEKTQKPRKTKQNLFLLKIVAQNNKTHSQATCWHCVPE